MSAYVVNEFPLCALLVVMGLISAGLSPWKACTSLSTSITKRFDSSLSAGFIHLTDQTDLSLAAGHRVMAVVLIVVSWDNGDPSSGVGIFAQNGVYAYFSAAFMPF